MMTNRKSADETDLYIAKELSGIRKANFVALGITAVILTSLVVLGFFTTLDVCVPATGELRPATWRQVTTEVPGQVRTVLVEEGTRVAPGRVLLQLDNAEIAANLEASGAELSTLKTQVLEYEAEILGASREIQEAIAQKMAAAAQLEADLRRLESGGNPGMIAVARALVEKASTAVQQADRALVKAREEGKQGIIPGKEVDQAEDRLSLAKADLDIQGKELARAEKPYTPQEIDSARAKLLEARHAVAEAEARWGEIAVFQAKINTLGERILETEVGLRHLEASKKALSITSPVAGKILTHDPKTLEGTWAKPGDPLLSIGTSEGFVVDGELKEDFLPRVRPGLAAKIYLRAFPFMEYRVLEGEVVGIGERFETGGGESGASSAQKNVTPIRISLRDTAIEQDGESFPLRPGLSAEVRIIIKRAGVWDLLIETAQKWRSKQLTG
jgi:multidrug resistance efflux pump